MKKKIFSVIIVAVILMLSAMTVSAEAPYQTYSYSYSGNVQISPTAYSPESRITEFGKAGVLNAPTDVFYDSGKKRILIADSGNNRIVITNEKFETLSIIDKFKNNGKEDSLNAPGGVFVTSEGNLYVADTKNSRIIVFDSNNKFLKELPPIQAKILPEGFSYNPKSIVVDGANNVYVVSEHSNMGVVSLDPDGNFEGFIGAQASSANPLDAIWRSFMTEEQLERTESNVSVEYSNITIDEKGFLYVTCEDIDRYNLYNSVQERSKDATYSPIKKINPSGTDVMLRNGFFPPVGEINFEAYTGSESIAPSRLCDVELMENGMYVLLDREYNKLFFYDSNGNLLYAFGGMGEAVGFYQTPVSVAANKDIIYVLDSQTGSVTVLSQTEYGKLISKVVGLQENREFDEANKIWEELLSKNNNFDMAYLGIGKIQLENGDYAEAMENFKLIGNKQYYEKAFKLYRETILNKIGLILFIVIAVILFLVLKATGKISKYNDKLTEHKFSGKFKDELLYGFYVIRHPFNGNWGLKAEGRGSVRAATFWLVATGISSIVATFGACYLQKSDNPSLISALSNTVFPLLLIIVSNMCFTTLMDGKGTFKNVYITVCYSTIPYVITTIPFTLLSYVLVNDELAILSMASSLVLAWVLLLVFTGLMSVHDYSFGKNVIVVILTILGVAFILFILMIFVSLCGKMLSLFTAIINEVSFRS